MSEHNSDESPTALAVGLIDKLRKFADELGDDERQLLAALLSPGIAAAYDTDEGSDDGDGDGPSSTSWTTARLPEHLRAAIEHRSLRVEGW